MEKASAPFLSVVTVSLNAAGTIEGTLSSVAQQKAPFGIEHICVDGGSRDDTRAIIDRWAARSGHVVRIYEPDKGIFDAMNKGLTVARGEYVLFLNADDFLMSAETLACALAACWPQSAADAADLLVGDALMGVIGRFGVWRHRRVPRLLGRLGGIGLYPVHQAQFSKRAILLSVGGFDSRCRLASDVTQYYEVERRFSPRIEHLRFAVSFMSAGGAANRGLSAMWLGSKEIFQHLAPRVGPVRALLMVLMKTLQSVSEVRVGRCPGERWYEKTP